MHAFFTYAIVYKCQIGTLVKMIGDDMNKNYTISTTKFHHVQKQSFADEHLGFLSSNRKSVMKDWMPAPKSWLAGHLLC